MNILIIPSWYQNKKQPTSGSFFKEQAIALSKEGHSVILLDVTMLGTKSISKEEICHVARYKDNGITIYSFKSYSFGLGRFPRIYYKIFEFKLNLMLRKIIREHKIDVMHVHSVYPAGIAAINISKKFQLPIVYTEHRGGFGLTSLSNRNREMLKRVIENCDHTIYVSKFLMNSINRQICTNTKSTVVPNAVNELFIHQPRYEKTVFTFLSVGRLVKIKRMDLTIKAFAEALKKVDAKLIIAGDGPEKENLKQLVENLKITDKVEFVGQATREEISDLLIYCDAFILASDVESFGVVYLEALAVGRPVVTTRNGGAEEIINDTNGTLVEVGNLKGLANAIEQTILNYSKYDSKIISSECLERYSYKRVVRQLEEIYIKVIQKEKNVL